MRPLWEAIQDNDKEVDSKSKEALFYPFFAECFVKVFGKLDRRTRDNRIGVKEVGDETWYFDNWRTNQFILEISKMNQMIKKQYHDLEFAIESHDQQKMAVNPDVWLVKYLLSWRFGDEDEKHGVDWHIDVVRTKDKFGHNVIVRFMPFELSRHALKHRELLKIIEDNV